MAYTFQNTLGLVGDDEKNAAQKANIFAAPGVAGEEATEIAGAGGAPGVQKTSTAGEGVAGGPQATQAGGGEAVPTSTSTPSKARVIQRGAQRIRGPAAFQKIGESLAGAKEQLQSEAQKYAERQSEQQQYGLAPEEIEKAIGGQEEARGRVTGLLGGTAAKQREEFEAPDVNVEDVALLRAGEPGIAELFRRQLGGAQYTAPEAQLDLALMRRSPTFQRTISQLIGEQEALTKQAGETEQRVESEAEKLRQERLAAAQQEARQYLTGQQQTLQAQNEAEAAAENQVRAALQGTPDQAYIEQEVQKAIDEVRARFGGEGTRLSRFIPGAVGGIETSPYYGVGGQLGWQQFINPEEAQRFNAIMGLLGQGGQTLAAAPELGPRQTFNLGGYEETLTGAAQAREAEDRARLMGLIGGVEQTAAQRAQDLMAERANLPRGEIAGRESERIINAMLSDPNVDPEFKRQVERWRSQPESWRDVFQAEYGPYFLENLRPEEYLYTDPTQYAAENVYTPEELDQLRGYYGELQQAMPGYAAGNIAAPWSFNEQAYRDYLIAEAKAIGDKERQREGEPEQPVSPGGEPTWEAPLGGMLPGIDPRVLDTPTTRKIIDFLNDPLNKGKAEYNRVRDLAKANGIPVPAIPEELPQLPAPERSPTIYNPFTGKPVAATGGGNVIGGHTEYAAGPGYKPTGQIVLGEPEMQLPEGINAEEAAGLENLSPEDRERLLGGGGFPQTLSLVGGR